MRRSVLNLFAAAAAAVAAAVAAPASAAKPIVNTLPGIDHPCDVALPSPDATACAGYYTGNLINGSPADRQNQADAIATLPGGAGVFDGSQAAWDALDPEFKITSLTNGNQLDFGVTLFGLTIIGAHFGNVAGDAGNVTVFWQFDFGAAGADFVVLDDPSGWSNAVLYTTGSPPVPEPATWAMMLLGFGVAGTALRRSRRTGKLAQLA